MLELYINQSFYLHHLNLVSYVLFLNRRKPLDLSFHMVAQMVKSPCNAGDPSSIPGSGRSPGGGTGYPLQYSCLENPMDRGAWQATVPGVAKSQTQLSS